MEQKNQYNFSWFRYRRLETLDEIKNEALETFQEHGGKNLNYINCLNDGKKVFHYYLN